MTAMPSVTPHGTAGKPGRTRRSPRTGEQSSVQGGLQATGDDRNVPVEEPDGQTDGGNRQPDDQKRGEQIAQEDTEGRKPLPWPIRGIAVAVTSEMILLGGSRREDVLWLGLTASGVSSTVVCQPRAECRR